MQFRLACVLLLLVAAESAFATISGPTTSTGEFTLSWSGSGNPIAHLEDVSTGRQHTTSPVSFSKAAGTYEFRERACIFLPVAQVSTCHVVDTHTVTVSSDDASADQTSARPVVRKGDYDNDGRTDLAVVAPSAGTRRMGDFILRNLGNGALGVVTNATSAQISAARSWPAVSGAVAWAGDITFDGKIDVVITGLGSLVAGASSVAVWSDPDGLTDYPTVAAALNAERKRFLSETANAFANSSHYDNAIVRRCVTESGWVLTVVYIDRPGWYRTINGGWVYINEPGYYRAAFYVRIGECHDAIDASVVTSNAAYIFYRNWLALDGDVADDDFKDRTRRLWEILRIVFGVELGKSGRHPPYDDLEDSEESAAAVWVWLEELCQLIRCRAVADATESAVAIRLNGEVCSIKLLLREVPLSPTPFRMPKVTHPATQDFSITGAQRIHSMGTTDAARLSFWRSRWNTSKDPLGPLAVDVVNNAYLLGCMANERLKWYALWRGRTITLTDVGASIMVAHVKATDGEVSAAPTADVGFRGKLSARQIAQYHHEVFRQLRLPPQTFGGTPLTGALPEADRTKFIWCRSCD